MNHPNDADTPHQQEDYRRFWEALCCYPVNLISLSNNILCVNQGVANSAFSAAPTSFFKTTITWPAFDFSHKERTQLDRLSNIILLQGVVKIISQHHLERRPNFYLIHLLKWEPARLNMRAVENKAANAPRKRRETRRVKQGKKIRLKFLPRLPILRRRMGVARPKQQLQLQNLQP